MRPKLSRAFQEEISVRTKLGISRKNHRAKGYQGAKRARAELDRRERYKRQRGFGWDDLSLDLINVILRHLTLLDLYHVRLAGLGCVSVSRSQHLKRAMQSRVAALEPIYWGALPMQAARLTPTQFSRRETLHLPSATPDVLQTVARDMPSVVHLEAGTYGAARLSTVPRLLERCTRLETLSLLGHELTCVPDPVLRLGSLRTLLLHGNTRLEALPDDIGVRLPRLRMIGLFRTKIKSLPHSLLVTLERNLTKRGRTNNVLLVSRGMFADGYLEETVRSDEFPKLADNLRRNMLNNHNFIDDD